MDSTKGIEKAIERHIRELELKGKKPTVDEVVSKVTRTVGFKIVKTVTGINEEGVRTLVKKRLK